MQHLQTLVLCFLRLRPSNTPDVPLPTFMTFSYFSSAQSVDSETEADQASEFYI
jgi:hypothetical protein